MSRDEAGLPKVSPTFAESEEEVTDWIRCSARKVARGG